MGHISANWFRVYLNILKHSRQLVDVIGGHADLAQPLHHVFFLFAVRT